jgi:hypothetical protein
MIDLENCLDRRLRCDKHYNRSVVHHFDEVYRTRRSELGQAAHPSRWHSLNAWHRVVVAEATTLVWRARRHLVTLVCLDYRARGRACDAGADASLTDLGRISRNRLKAETTCRFLPVEHLPILVLLLKLELTHLVGLLPLHLLALVGDHCKLVLFGGLDFLGHLVLIHLIV